MKSRIPRVILAMATCIKEARPGNEGLNARRSHASRWKTFCI